MGDYLRRAYEQAMLVASKTKDEGLRKNWLETVHDNREIVAEYETRGLGEEGVQVDQVV